MDGAGLDILLVGDSVAMVVHGHDTTLPVTLDEMLTHCKAVSRGSSRFLFSTPHFPALPPSLVMPLPHLHAPPHVLDDVMHLQLRPQFVL